MTDRELLELAAKAAGIPLHELDDTYGDCGGIEKDGWNPLTDDGDALRLANALKFSICHTLCEAPAAHGTAMVGYAPWEKGAPICSERYDGIEGRDAATRRAIVRAAVLADRERRAQPAPGAEAWQPIETAPKDHSVLLATDGSLTVTFCGRYRAGNLGEPQPGLVAWRCDSSGRFANPTHWMPLPAPPAAHSAGKGEA